MSDEKDIREEIKSYVEILKKEARYTVRRISLISKELGNPFTDSTLSKVYTISKEQPKIYRYELRLETLKGIADVLRIILRMESENYSGIYLKLKQKRLDIDPNKDYTSLNKKVDVNLIKIPQVTDRGHSRTLNNLITWADSATYEMFAEEVKAMTSNLAWIRAELKSIIDNLKQKENKYFKVILFTDEGAFEKKVIEKVAEKEGVRERLQIMDLYQGLDESIGFNGAFFPLPFDIVIYKNSKLEESDEPITVAVTNYDPVTLNDKPDSILDEKGEVCYDILLNQRVAFNLEIWFDSVWNKHCQEKFKVT